MTRDGPDAGNFRSHRMLPFWPVKLIVFDRVRPRGAPPILLAIVRFFGGGRTLGPGWTIEAERLAALLNAARDRWAGSPQSG